MIKVKDVVGAMDVIAPPALALSGDPVGLHAGDPDSPVKSVLIAMDASLPVLAEAIRRKAQMLVVHHPRFYRGLTTLAETDPAGRRAVAIARSGLAVYSAHTALDMAEGGTNDRLAEAAGIQKPVIIKPETCERLLKLAVFVPATHVEKVRKAICDAGAGCIGKYSDCTFRTRGMGTFKPGADTTPFIGKSGELEEVDEFRLETVFGEFITRRILAALQASHPYEEVAYELYPMMGSVRNYGFGRVGKLVKWERLADFAARMAKATGSRMAQFCGKGDTRVERVAVWAGGGVDVKAVLSCNAEVLVAGELGYHDMEALADAGISAVTLGHGHSEELALPPLAARLRSLLPGIDARVTKKGTTAFNNVMG